MCADQREAVLVVANLLQRNLPALHCVTAFAVGAKLPAMNVRVAVRAMRADILEDQADVALVQATFCVHAAQRIAGVIVIELRIGADRFPAGVGVALLAGNRNADHADW